LPAGSRSTTDWEIVPLLDAEGSFVTYAEAFPALDVERLEKTRADWPETFRGDRWWLPFHAFLLRGPSLVVVDAGVGPTPNDFLPDAKTCLPRELERAGVDAADVELVFFTHLHVDHVGWAPLFTAARAVVHAADLAHFDRPATRAKLEHFGSRVDAIDAATEIAPGLRAVPTPGHTPGHTSLSVDGAFILGDVAVHPAQVADPALAFTYGDGDPERASATRRATLAQLADEEATVVSPHLPGVFGRVVRAGEGFAWHPSK
jgi:glyoxylase-like metal-dependent hydrolase (beta-lactamase superfamily II)